jgi:hypothetical protein
MMLLKLDVFITLRNDETGMDERDIYWSMIMHGDCNKLVRIEDNTISEDFKTLKAQ